MEFDSGVLFEGCVRGYGEWSRFRTGRDEKLTHGDLVMMARGEMAVNGVEASCLDGRDLIPENLRAVEWGFRVRGRVSVRCEGAKGGCDRLYLDSDGEELFRETKEGNDRVTIDDNGQAIELFRWRSSRTPRLTISLAMRYCGPMP
jgi:hypothetical protein